MKRVLIVGAALAAVLGCSASEPLPLGAQPPVALPAEAINQLQALLAEKAARTPTQRKISSQLLYQRNGLIVPPADVLPLTAPDQQGRVLVDIKHSLGASLEGRVADLGGTVTHSSVSHHSVRAWMPLARLEELAGDAIVLAIRPALQGMNRRAPVPGAKLRWSARPDRIEALADTLEQARKERGPIYQAASEGPGATTSAGVATSAGDVAHGTNRARKFFNTDGGGVKVGVLSDSDDFREQSIATGDLPADVVTVPGQDGRPGAGEGTAMMEIVHDLAPGAKLFFATAFNSPESFAENIRTLRFVYGCDVIVDDVIYFFESPYEDDIVAQAVADVVADGALYFSSAGNEGNLADGTSSTWEGDFKSGGLLGSLPDGYLVHDFGEKNISNRVQRGAGPVILHWSDPGTLDAPASGNDYDLFVLTPDLRNVAVASTDIQDGDDLAFEFLPFSIPTGYRLVVAQHAGAETRAIRLANFGELGVSTHGAVWGHAAAPGAFGVGAINAALGPGGFSSGPTTQVELFSSDGNRRIFYDRNNLPLKGGVTFASGGGELRKKPDLSAADGVATTLPSFTGLNPFFGTSAAAPHAAAVAALLKSAVPTATPAKIRNALINGALDIEGDGVDISSGAGAVSAMNTLQKGGAKPAVFLEVGGLGISGPLNPGTTGILSVGLVNNGGADATNVRGTLTALTPGVSVIGPNFSLFPAIPAAGGTGASNSNYAFALSPALPCGQVVKFRLTVTFAGNGTSPAVLEIAVQTGTPAATAVPFSFTGPAVPIPDGPAPGVDVPLAVAGIGTISNVQVTFDGDSCTSAAGATTVGLDHSWVGDLVISLTSPAGTTVNLMNRPGGPNNSANNFCGTVLSDDAVNSIQDVSVAQAPYTGTFKPASPLAALKGQNADGTWLLSASDQVATDVGNVRAFTLQVSGFTCGP
jgi:hypothetical protein